MTEIVFRAGFGSVRRFNAAFADLYGRSPSSLRAKGRGRRD
jgi:AraC family transcriptional regulator of adaptative response / DNA-3-methyladenine glycosylase II